MRPTWGPLAVRLAFLVAALGVAAQAGAQTTFPVAFHKISDADDSVEDVRSGFPPVRRCPDPCQTLHAIVKIINCQSAGSDGSCIGPNARPITGGSFVDNPAFTLPLDCARGVVVGGAGTSDPPVCDTATNTLTVNNINVPAGQTMTISFWMNVNCDSGAVQNQATFDYDQNPNAAPLVSDDPVSFGNPAALTFQVGAPIPPSQPTKNAPNLPIEGNPARRNGAWGISTPWVIQGVNPNCAPITFTAAWDQTNPQSCMEVDCSTLRWFVNDVPAPLPPGSLCPDGVRPAAFSFGEFTLQPGDTFRIEYDALFTRNTAVGQCCNVMFFRTGTTPDITTIDPSLDTRLNPEETCVNLALATATVLDAIKDAEDASGRPITQVRPGDDIYWHFTLTYEGADPVTGSLNDDFPAAAVLSAGSIVEPFPDGTCVIAGQNLSCTGVTLPNDGTPIEMRVRTTLDCTAVTGGSEICNEATVSTRAANATTHCSTCLPAAPANRTCVTLLAPSFEFAGKSVTDASGDGLVTVGETVTYRIQATNTGTTEATNVVVTDTVPAGGSYVPGTLRLDGVLLTDAVDGDGGEVTGGLVTVRFPLAPVLDFDIGVITFDVMVDAQAGPQFCNSAAEISWAEAALCAAPPASVQEACLDFDTTIPTDPQLSASKSVAPAGIVDPGTVLHYTIGACNGATAGAATGVKVNDAIPAGTTYVPGSMLLQAAPLTDAADVDAGVYSLGIVQVLAGDLAPGECKTVEFEVTVDAATTADVVNSARVTADAGTPATSNEVTTPVRATTVPPQLTLTKTSLVLGGNPARVGSTITYTLNACNGAAAGPAANVAISDAIPLDAVSGCGATYVADSIRVDGIAQTDAPDGDAARFDAAPAPGGINVDLAALAPGACVAITFDVTVAAGCDDTELVLNTGAVDADDVTPVSSNTTSDAVTVDVNPPEPIMMRKEGGPLVDRCITMPTPCGCEVGPRLDPVADDCVTLGTCTEISVTEWLVPGDVTGTGARLVFYELHRAGCQAAGDPTRLAVTKQGQDVRLTLVP